MDSNTTTPSVEGDRDLLGAELRGDSLGHGPASPVIITTWRANDEEPVRSTGPPFSPVRGPTKNEPACAALGLVSDTGLLLGAWDRGAPASEWIHRAHPGFGAEIPVERLVDHVAQFPPIPPIPPIPPTRRVASPLWRSSSSAGYCRDQATSEGERHGFTCGHLDLVENVTPSAAGCEDCLQTGDSWVHLRICMACGHVGCCDNSPNRHATAHRHGNHDHPLVRSFEPGEDWWWWYADDPAFEVSGAVSTPSYH